MVVTERSWSVLVPHHPGGARAARHRLTAELSAALPAPLLADAVAVLAELVGNAVRHARPLPGGVIRVCWRMSPTPGREVVELRVTDGGAEQPPRVRHAGPEALDGRGLSIVAALADRWGVERDEEGQSVWARLSLAGRERAAPTTYA